METRIIKAVVGASKSIVAPKRFKKAYTKRILDKCKRNDLTVVDTDGSESLVKTII